MEDINLSPEEIKRLQEGHVLLKSFASDQYGIDSAVTIRLGGAKNPRCGRRNMYGSGNKNPCVLSKGHVGDCPPDESEKTLILPSES